MLRDRKGCRSDQDVRRLFALARFFFLEGGKLLTHRSSTTVFPAKHSPIGNIVDLGANLITERYDIE